MSMYVQWSLNACQMSLPSESIALLNTLPKPQEEKLRIKLNG